MDKMAEELRQKDEQLVVKTELVSRLQEEMESTRSKLQQDAASWQRANAELREKLGETEMARQVLLGQLTEIGRELDVQRERGEEEFRASLERCHAELERKCEEERERREELEGRLAEGQHQQEVMEERCAAEKKRREVCELEREELRKEVTRLGVELRACQQELEQALREKAEREQSGEDMLVHLQQELAKRAQQVRQEMMGNIRK